VVGGAGGVSKGVISNLRRYTLVIVTIFLERESV
jgi:hypothetical protein